MIALPQAITVAGPTGKSQEASFVGTLPTHFRIFADSGSHQTMRL
jgi:hypothetical protein